VADLIYGTPPPPPYQPNKLIAGHVEHKKRDPLVFNSGGSGKVV